jgi:hypothetical protein
MVQISPVLLRNRGVPVTVACLTPDLNGVLIPAFNAGGNGSGEVMTEQRWVRVTNNVLVDIEETWGDFAEFAKAAEAKPAGTIRKFLSLVWEEDPKVTGNRMLSGRLDEYAGACAAAIMVAQGVDPQVAAKMLETGIKVTSVQAVAATKEAQKMLDEVEKSLAKLDNPDESTGEPGGPSGSESVSILTPSGE